MQLRGKTFVITRNEYLEPGTDLFNHVFQGGKFMVTRTTTKLVRWTYTDYGKFTGRIDWMQRARFERHVKTGLFLAIPEPAP